MDGAARLTTKYEPLNDHSKKIKRFNRPRFFCGGEYSILNERELILLFGFRAKGRLYILYIGFSRE